MTRGTYISRGGTQQGGKTLVAFSSYIATTTERGFAERQSQARKTGLEIPK